jgi:hypothetical protein
MADPSPYTDFNTDTGEETPATPRWVKVFGIIAIVVALLFVMLHIGGGGSVGH